jgi:hypothetical protein
MRKTEFCICYIHVGIKPGSTGEWHRAGCQQASLSKPLITLDLFEQSVQLAGPQSSEHYDPLGLGFQASFKVVKRWLSVGLAWLC